MKPFPLRVRLGIGIAALVALTVYMRWSPPDEEWASPILLLAPLALVPAALVLVRRDDDWQIVKRLDALIESAQMPAAVLLASSFLFEQGNGAALSAAPWFIVTVMIAANGVIRVRQRGFMPLDSLAVHVGMIYIAAGGAWIVISRAGLQPMDFPEIIVLLTGVHFHYAGFLFPIMAGFAASKNPSIVASLATLGTIVSVPMVAVGITMTQRGKPWVYESFAAVVAMAAGLLVAAAYLPLVTDKSLPIKVRGCFVVVVASLAVAMPLAGAYGLSYLGAPALEIPEMVAVHGTTLALGFGLCSVLGWHWASSGRESR